MASFSYRLSFSSFSMAKNICRNVSYDMWGITGEFTLALTVAKTSFHYDWFAISVPARSLLLFDDYQSLGLIPFGLIFSSSNLA